MLHFSCALLIMRKMDFFFWLYIYHFTAYSCTPFLFLFKSSALVLWVWEAFRRGDQCGVQH